MGGVNVNVYCGFKCPCFARKHKKCMILTAMPKPRKDGTCPFAKTEQFDIKEEKR